MKYHIYIENRMVAEIAGYEAANLVDSETGEVIESSDDWDDYEPADIDSDMGFDPYMGCYSDDC